MLSQFRPTRIASSKLHARPQVVTVDAGAARPDAGSEQKRFRAFPLIASIATHPPLTIDLDITAGAVMNIAWTDKVSGATIGAVPYVTTGSIDACFPL